MMLPYGKKMPLNLGLRFFFLALWRELVIIIPMSDTVICLRCSHTWRPRVDELPKACPRCKKYDWNTPKSEGFSPAAMVGTDKSAEVEG